MSRILLSLFVFIFCAVHNETKAQIIRRKTALPNEQAPKAVLVELFSGYKRLQRSQEDFTKAELISALTKANEKMILDFEDNFKYCPVYYFYDSNIVAIQNGRINEFLLDANGQKISNSVLEDGDTTFFILYYGILVPDESTPFDTHVTKKMLVALDFKGDLLPFPLPRTPGPATYKNFKSKKFNVFYRYTNTITDTHYRACALRYSHLLEDFYGKSNYMKKKK